MINFIENKYPYILALGVGIVFFTAFALEHRSHKVDNEYKDDILYKYSKTNNDYKEQLAQKEEKIEELQGIIDAYHLFGKRKK